MRKINLKVSILNISHIQDVQYDNWLRLISLAMLRVVRFFLCYLGLFVFDRRLLLILS